MSPFAFWTSAFAFWSMMAEAQAVMSLRLLGLAGVWTMAPGESARMVSEKQTAFAEAGLAAAQAMARGHPERALDAAVRPIGRTTRANARRLGRSFARRRR